MVFTITRKLGKKVLKHARKPKCCYELPHIHHPQASSHDLVIETTPIRAVLRPSLKRAGSDATEILQLMKEKVRDILKDAETKGWIILPSYEKGLREAYLLPIKDKEIDHFLMLLKEALENDEKPLVGMQPAFDLLRLGSIKTRPSVNIILTKDWTLARAPGCLYLSFHSASVPAGKRRQFFRSWTE
ncbi:hypothetical protein QFC19_006784 [Naganishia cerealis]|uniref:Uncharacterized protein n=1 Tax=Naganishia cerealis TaxID=610337 RepID=A0ACC2VE24_9TREE|nr:hypothetical protein QFC19_006784 [Naganishia cerealis]